MLRPCLLLTIVAALGPGLAGAQPLDEATYVARAVAADPRPGIAAADEREARAEALERGLRANPELVADREHVLGDGGEVEHVLALEVPLDLSGRRGRRVAAARARADAARAGGEATEVDVALDAMSAYREASFRRARAALLEQGHGELERAVEIVRARVGAGDAAPYELERAELELVEYDDELAAAVLARDAAERALGARVGMEQVETAGDVPLPDEPAAADALLERAAGRADVERLRHLGRAADAERAAAGRAWIPDVLVRGGAKSLSAADETRWGYVVGIGIELPIFGRAAPARARAAAERQRVDAAQRGLSGRTAARIAAARAELVRWRELAARTTEARGQRIAALITASEAAYREGGTLVELLDAYRMRRRAQLTALEQRHQARTAEVDLWRAIGRRP